MLRFFPSLLQPLQLNLLKQRAATSLPVAACNNVLHHSQQQSYGRSFSTSANPEEVGLTYMPSLNLALINLSRDKAKNAFSKKFLASFYDQINKIINHPADKPPIRGVLLWSSVQGTFSAGADLIERSAMTEAEIVSFVGSLRTAFGNIEKLPMPTIACIDGFALAGGMELSLACDFRVGTQKTIMGLPETSLGIMPGAGGTQRLPRIIGSQKAKYLLYTSKRMCAAEALDLGVLDFVSGVNDDSLKPLNYTYKSSIHTSASSGSSAAFTVEQTSSFPAHHAPLKDLLVDAKELPKEIKEAIKESSNDTIADAAAKSEALFVGLKLMQHLVSMGRIGLQAVKAAVREGAHMSLHDASFVDRQEYENVLRAKDRLEALAAFKEKRVPVLKGD